MKFIRKSIFLKAVVEFLAVFGLISGAIYFAKQYYAFDVFHYPPFILIAVSNGVLILFFLVFFLRHVYFPLKKVYREVNALLTGKTYRRIIPSSIDEIGVLTHFFNEITRNLEQISFDMKDRKRMVQELDIASKIQNDVLPKDAVAMKGLDIVAKTRSAAEVGGGCFDFLHNDDDTFIYIGDVTGHGVPAGLVMMMVDTLIHVFCHLKRISSDIIIETNKFLTPRISAMIFMTLVMIRWNIRGEKLYFTGAGHEYILIYRAKIREVEAIPSGGIALGMIPDISKIAVEKEIPLEIDDVIVLYSDGITEAKNNYNEMYGVERLSTALKKHGYRASAESIFDKITENFADFVGEYVQNDDITLIVIKYNGKQTDQKSIKLLVNSSEDKLKMSKRWNWK